ncbi:MAG: hypothetical protein ICV78_15070 [Tolypothrix sp. Co-bin9]|nr:hypothetical protein [Tolypothrix sp. Co-bin9]
MLDFNTITELSRANCATICAFLVPANLLATFSAIILAALRRPTHQVWQACTIGSFFAVVMILHVYTWFMIGVVMAPTYILMWLAITCLLSNFGAILLQRHIPKILSFGR